MFVPDPEGCRPDLMATSGDYLRLWRISEEGVALEKLLNNVRQKRRGGRRAGRRREGWGLGVKEWWQWWRGDESGRTGSRVLVAGTSLVITCSMITRRWTSC